MIFTARVAPSGIEHLGCGAKQAENEKNHLHAHATALDGTNDRVIIVEKHGTAAGEKTVGAVPTGPVLWKRGQIIDPGSRWMLVFVYLFLVPSIEHAKKHF